MHSLHAYFLQGGDAKQPIYYLVKRTRDGLSFSNRRVQAMQNQRVILEMMVSFQVEVAAGAEVLEHQASMPAVWSPQQCAPDDDGRARAIFDIHGDVRAVPQKPPTQADTSLRQPTSMTQALWFKGERLGDWCVCVPSGSRAVSAHLGAGTEGPAPLFASGCIALHC